MNSFQDDLKAYSWEANGSIDKRPRGLLLGASIILYTTLLALKDEIKLKLESIFQYIFSQSLAQL